jgi:hypothetical protein
MGMGQPVTFRSRVPSGAGAGLELPHPRKTVPLPMGCRVLSPANPELKGVLFFSFYTQVDVFDAPSQLDVIM